MAEADLIDALRADNSFQWLARRVEPEVAARVEALGLTGIRLYDEPTRVTPAGDLARSVLGRTDPDHRGATGLELQFDEVLTGEPGEMRYERAPVAGRSPPPVCRSTRPSRAATSCSPSTAASSTKPNVSWPPTSTWSTPRGAR